MIRAREDRWFDRFRRTGDPRALAKVFDRTAPELWRVAVHLCRDRHAAEDAVQGAFLVALEARSDWDATRPLLPWLLGLLANRVREGRRQQAKVPDAARLTQPGERDPADLAAQQEFGAAFSAALQRLAEPFRSVLERHLVHGVAAAELAAERGVAAGTVRMQLHRGLDQLRQKLPQGFVAGGVAMAALSPESFAAMRQVVLAEVPGGSAVLATSGSGAALVGGFAALWLPKVALVAVATVVAVVGWTWFGGTAEAVGGALVQTPLADERAERPASSDVGAPGSIVSAAVPERFEAPAARSTGTLRVLLRNAGNHEGIAGAEVQVLQSVRVLDLPRQAAPAAAGSAPAPQPAAAPATPATSAAQSVQTGTSDAAGVVTFVVTAGEVQIKVDGLLDAPLGIDVPADRVTERLVDVPVRIAADVLVVDAVGLPVADALLQGRRNAYLGGQYTVLGRTGADGRWRQDCIERTLQVRATVDGLAASAAVLLNEQTQAATLQLGGAAATLHGSVFAQDGQPMPMAWLAIQPQTAPKDSPLPVRADALGRYRCAYVPPGPCAVFAWHDDGPGENRFATAPADAVAGVATLVDVRFGRGASIRAQLHKPGGAPWHGVHVTALPQLRLGFGIDVYRRVATDGRGEAFLDGLLPGAYELQVRVENEDHHERVVLEEGQDFEFVRELGGAAWVEVHAVDAEQRPLAGWTAKLQVRDGQVPWTRPVGEVQLDAQGLARFSRLPAQPFVVSLRASPSGFASVVREAPPNQRTEVVVPRAQHPEAKLRGVIAPSEGMSFAELRVVLGRAEIEGRRNIDARDGLDVAVDPTGQFAFAGLPAGTYYLGILQESTDPNRAPRMVGMHPGIEVAAKSEVDLGTIEVGTSTLRVRVARADGVAVVAPRLLLGLGKVEASMSRGAVQADGVIEAKELPPGTYEGFVWGENIAPVAVPIEVRAGVVCELPVVASAAIATTFRFVGLPAGITFGQTTVSLAGVVLVRELIHEPDARCVRGLLPGSYRIEFETPMVASPVRGAAEFTVGNTPGPVVEVRVAK